MLTWRDQYSIGNEEIDNQHKTLFGICDHVFTILKNDFDDNTQSKIIVILDELKNYTKVHFDTEERLMLSINYPSYTVHKAEHDDFIIKLNELQFRDLAENQNVHLHEILKWIINWISSHILDKDKLIGVYIASNCS